MLTDSEREKAESIVSVIAYSKEHGTRLLLSNYEIEWLADKLIYCDDYCKKMLKDECSHQAPAVQVQTDKGLELMCTRCKEIGV